MKGLNNKITRLTISSYISRIRLINRIGVGASFILGLLLFFVVLPLYNVTGVEDTEAATGTAKDSEVVFTSTRNTASVSLTTASTGGTFAKSVANSTDAAFNIYTNNSQGYKLQIKADSTVLKTSSSAADTTGLSAIASSRAEGSFAANTWGYLPNYYNSSSNTSTYYPITTSYVTLMDRNSANSSTNRDYFTIGLGAKADFSKASGKYTLGGNSSTISLYYVANPTSYSITFNKGNTTDTVNNMPYSSTGNVLSGSVSATSITVTDGVPTRSGYTFKGWCTVLPTTTSGVDTCKNSAGTTGTTYNASGATSWTYGIDRQASNENVTLYALWEGNQYTATYYYQSNATSGSTTVSSTTQTCRVTNSSNNCVVDIPSTVRSSVGTYNNAYYGLSTGTGNMTASSNKDATSITISGNTSRYALYSTSVTLYKPSSTTARTSVALYRNQWLSSTSAMAGTVMASAANGTSNYSYSAAVSGYTLYGFATAANTYTRTYSNLAGLTQSTTTTAYAIDYDADGASATFYYYNKTATNNCNTASVTSTTGTAARYNYTTASAATTTSGETISIPSAVSNSKGVCGMAYLNVGANNSMTAASSITAGNTYYAHYSQTLTSALYYYSSGWKSQTLYRNQWVSSTSGVSSMVLSTSQTGTANYTTAGGPGSSAASWAGLATSNTTTVAYSSVSAAATASSVYTSGTTHFYTIYQFNVTYSTSGSTGVSSIGATSGSCKINATGASAGSTSCNVTLPSITPNANYESLGWATTSGHTSAGTAAGGSYSLSTNNVTLYANAKQSKLWFQNATSANCGSTMYDNRGTDTYKNVAYTTKKIGSLCWMTRNLDLPGGTALSSSDTNLSSGFTLPASSTSGFNGYNTDYVYNSGRTTCSNNSSTGSCYSYYSWYTATAHWGTSSVSSGSSSVDICPKGWRLPTRAEYNTLVGTSGYNTGANLVSNWSAVYSGGYYVSSFVNGGSSGYYWSSTANGSNGAYSLYFDSSSAGAGYDFDKYRGFAIRCVAKS